VVRMWHPVGIDSGPGTMATFDWPNCPVFMSSGFQRVLELPHGKNDGCLPKGTSQKLK
jgi:hypothetical protein